MAAGARTTARRAATALPRELLRGLRPRRGRQQHRGRLPPARLGHLDFARGRRDADYGSARSATRAHARARADRAAPPRSTSRTSFRGTSSSSTASTDSSASSTRSTAASAPARCSRCRRSRRCRRSARPSGLILGGRSRLARAQARGKRRAEGALPPARVGRGSRLPRRLTESGPAPTRRRCEQRHDATAMH